MGLIKRLGLWLLFLPVQASLILLFFILEVTHKIFARRPSRKDTPVEGLCSIIVLNWNGLELLQESLPALRRALVADGGNHEVIVVDNGSTDGSVEWLQRQHPWVRTVKLDRNLGFGEGNNRGVKAARHPIVVLLNNDMIVSEDFLAPLLNGFRDPDVFAVTSQIHMPAGKRREETGNTAGAWERGYLHLSHEPIQRRHRTRSTHPVLWAGGGSSAFHRERFLELGGFSPIFSPAYVEDTDLSYRAWRRGWKVMLAARSEVVHKHRSTSRRRFDEDQIRAMVETRKLWYLWKNFQFRTLVPHFLLLPTHLGGRIVMDAYRDALKGLPRVLATRLAEPRRAVSDRTLFRWVARPWQYLRLQKQGRSERRRKPPLRILFVSAYLPHLGKHGGAGRVFQLLRRVAGRHRVSLVCFVESREEERDVAQVEPYCERIETVLRRGFEPVSPFPYEPFEEFNCPQFRQRLEEVRAEADFDLVHFEWTQMAAYADLFEDLPKLVTEIEVNYAAHQSQSRVEKNVLGKTAVLYRTLQTLYREVEMCRRVDRVVCVTDTDSGFLAGYVDPGKLEVVNTGVDTSFFAPGEDSLVEESSLVFVGAFRHSPNVDAMLHFCKEILPLVHRAVPKAHLYIVGSSPPREIRRLANHPRITVTGFVEDIREYYHRAQVVVVPLRTGVGIRGKILEGWAAGKAMVATPLACLGIRAIHGENILISDDPQRFADWTVALLRHPEHCKRLGGMGRLTAERFYEWDQLAEQMNHVYQDTASRWRAPGVESHA